MIVILGRLIQLILALLTIRFATTFLSPNEMGRMMLVLSTISLFSLFLVSPVGMFITRRLYSWNESGVLIFYLRYHVVFLLTTSLLAALIMLLLIKLRLINFDMSNALLISLLCGSLFLTTFNQTILSTFNILGYGSWFMILTITTGITGLLGAIFLTSITTYEAGLWIAGLIFGQVLSGLIGWIVLCKKSNYSNKTPNIALLSIYKASPMILSFVWPLNLVLLLSWAHNQFYRFIFEDLLGVYALGLFVAGLGVGIGIISALESVLTTYLLPSLYKKINSKIDGSWINDWSNYASLTYSILIMSVVFISCLTAELTKILVGYEYQSAVKYVAWGALIELTRVSVGVISLVAHAKMITKKLIAPAIFGALTSVFTVFILISKYGEVGVAAGLFFSGLVWNILAVYFVLGRSTISLSYSWLLKIFLMGMIISLMIYGIKFIPFSTSQIISSLAVVILSGAIFLILMYLMLDEQRRKLLT